MAAQKQQTAHRKQPQRARNTCVCLTTNRHQQVAVVRKVDAVDDMIAICNRKILNELDCCRLGICGLDIVNLQPRNMVDCTTHAQLSFVKV